MPLPSILQRKKAFQKKGAFMESANLDALPRLPLEVLDMMEKKGFFSCEGIFRISGNAADIQVIVKSFTKKKPVALSGYGAHELSCALKQYLRELDNPLLLSELYPVWIAAEELEPAMKVPAVNKLLNVLPPANKAVLDRLLHFLQKVSELSDQTKMDASNLAVVFSPTLLRSKEQNLMDELEQMPKAKSITAYLIENYHDGRVACSVASAPPSIEFMNSFMKGSLAVIKTMIVQQQHKSLTSMMNSGNISVVLKKSDPNQQQNKETDIESSQTAPSLSEKEIQKEIPPVGTAHVQEPKMPDTVSRRPPPPPRIRSPVRPAEPAILKEDGELPLPIHSLPAAPTMTKLARGQGQVSLLGYQHKPTCEQDQVNRLDSRSTLDLSCDDHTELVVAEAPPPDSVTVVQEENEENETDDDFDEIKSDGDDDDGGDFMPFEIDNIDIEGTMHAALATSSALGELESESDISSESPGRTLSNPSALKALMSNLAAGNMEKVMEDINLLDLFTCVELNQQASQLDEQLSSSNLDQVLQDFSAFFT